MLWVGRVGGGKASFSQILLSLTIHGLSESCKYPLAPGLGNKIRVNLARNGILPWSPAKRSL